MVTNYSVRIDNNKTRDNTRGANSTLAHPWTHFPRTLSRRITDWLNERRAHSAKLRLVHHLKALDDVLLDDIGLTRDAVSPVALCPINGSRLCRRAAVAGQ